MPLTEDLVALRAHALAEAGPDPEPSKRWRALHAALEQAHTLPPNREVQALIKDLQAAIEREQTAFAQAHARVLDAQTRLARIDRALLATDRAPIRDATGLVMAMLGLDTHGY